jgi:four helix bundle protein
MACRPIRSGLFLVSSSCDLGADFIAKIAIAEEEADETQYWLELLFESGEISEVFMLKLAN